MELLRQIILDQETFRFLNILNSCVGMLVAVWVMARWEPDSK
jgi:hypothetical protein